MYYITFNNDTKKVVYVGNEKPSIGGNATIAEVKTLPEKYDCLTIDNVREEIDTWTEAVEEYNEETGEVVEKEVEKSRTYTTCDLKACFNFKPTAEQLEQSKERNKEKRYNELCERYIRQKYSASDEFKILRKKDFNNVEFNEYYDYVESCLARAKLEVYGG